MCYYLNVQFQGQRVKQKGLSDTHYIHFWSPCESNIPRISRSTTRQSPSWEANDNSPNRQIFLILIIVQLGQASLATLEGGSTVAEAVVTVLCTPDDGCR